MNEKFQMVSLIFETFPIPVLRASIILTRMLRKFYQKSGVSDELLFELYLTEN